MSFGKSLQQNAGHLPPDLGMDTRYWDILVARYRKQFAQGIGIQMPGLRLPSGESPHTLLALAEQYVCELVSSPTENMQRGKLHEFCDIRAVCTALRSLVSEGVTLSQDTQREA